MEVDAPGNLLCCGDVSERLLLFLLGCSRLNGDASQTTGREKNRR
jgi:hypothetical protein